jgi:hypothetical protein
MWKSEKKVNPKTQVPNAGTWGTLPFMVIFDS